MRLRAAGSTRSTGDCIARHDHVPGGTRATDWTSIRDSRFGDACRLFELAVLTQGRALPLVVPKCFGSADAFMLCNVHLPPCTTSPLKIAF